MITRIVGLIGVSLLVGCGGSGSNPVTGGNVVTLADATDPGTNTSTIPENLANNVQAVTFDPAAGTLSIELVALDGPDLNNAYLRNAALDVPGYQAYTFQDDPLDRMFIALGNSNTGNNVQAIVVADGGQFNRFFAGGNYEQIGAYSQPTSGQVEYAGSYAGVTNVQAAGDNLLDLPAGTDPSLLPSDLPAEAERITGLIFLNVNFATNQINGSIFQRSFVGAGTALDDISLIAATINADGTFLGTAELPDRSAAGSYGGTFGGTDAQGVAGIVHLTEFSGDIDNEQEYGLFVLDQCGAGAPAAQCPP